MRRRGRALARRYGRGWFGFGGADIRSSPETQARDRVVPQIAAFLDRSGYVSPFANAGMLYDSGKSLDDVKRLAAANRLAEFAVFRAS
jgi:hypothetical protein